MSAFEALIIILLYSAAYSEIRIFKENIFSTCLTNIIKNNFVQSTIFIANEDLQVHYKNLETTYTIINENQVGLYELPEQFNNFVIQTEAADSFKNTISYLKSTEGFNSRGKYLVVAKHKKDINATASVLWSQNLYKFVIIVQNSKGYAELHAVDRKTFACGKRISTHKIGTCKSGNVATKRPIFSKDVYKNFKNCTLPVVWSSEPPLVIHPNAATEPGIFVSVMNLIGTLL